MLYPLKFIHIYKDYIWGGRNFERLGRKLPDGISAESWEISCHPDGMSVVANGRFKGVSLQDLIRQYGRYIMGTSLLPKQVYKFPLLIKFIDANDNLSVQVHPDDAYARTYENEEYGKNEMWYVMEAEPGARVICGVVPGITRQSFAHAVKSNTIEGCLKSVEVSPGSVINIPAGCVHALGKGIMLAEIQQSSNATYRIYDYDRTDKYGNRRQLHIEKALDVIDFSNNGRKDKYEGLKTELQRGLCKKCVVANRHFAVELHDLSGKTREVADGRKFFIYIFTEGKGRITWGHQNMDIESGESVLIPASMGAYAIEGNLKFLKTYVPDIQLDVVKPLLLTGYSMDEILENVAGLDY